MNDFNTDMWDAMWSAIKILLGVIAVIALILTIIEVKTDAVQNATERAAETMAKKQEERFFWGGGNNGVADIIIDRETGVCYLWKAAGYKGGLTVLVDADGNPVIWEGENEDG